MKFLKYFGLFSFGGLVYGILEIAWKGSTHISMFIAGGICFLLIDLIDEARLFAGSVILQAPLGAVCITAVELVSGVVVNRLMNLGVWDYSGLPLNLWGQICLPFSAIWLALSIPAILVSRLLRRVMFEELPPPLRLLPERAISAEENI